MLHDLRYAARAPLRSGGDLRLQAPVWARTLCHQGYLSSAILPTLPCFAAVIMLGSAACASEDGSPPRKLVSPHGTYSIELTGARSTPTRLLQHHNVHASVVGPNGRGIRSFELYSAGFLDSGFDELFEKNEWPAENVLVFLIDSGSGAIPTSTLTIANKTESAIPCLEVNIGHLVLWFDVQPILPVTISVPTLPGNPIAAIAASTIFEDGKRRRSVGQRFERRQQSSPVKYSVVIGSTDLQVRADQ